MPPAIRKFSLATHIGLSVGWMGAVAAYIVLDVVVATASEASLLRAAYVSMDLLATFAIVPLALAALVTGVVMSLGTSWRLLHHWWVAISFVLTTIAVAVLLVEARVISRLGSLASDPASSDQALHAAGSTLPHSLGGMLVLVVVLFLNVYKPSGLTPYGWRRRYGRSPGGRS